MTGEGLAETVEGIQSIDQRAVAQDGSRTPLGLVCLSMCVKLSRALRPTCPKPPVRKYMPNNNRWSQRGLLGYARGLSFNFHKLEGRKEAHY
jgi:hypothetical protein